MARTDRDRSPCGWRGTRAAPPSTARARPDWRERGRWRRALRSRAQACSTRAFASVTLKPSTSKNTTAASGLRTSAGNDTSVLLMSPTTAVPDAADSAMASSMASRMSGAVGAALPPCSHDRTDPGEKLRRRRHLVAQVRQLEMRMRVDQPRQHGDLTEVDFPGFGVRRRAPRHGAIRAIGHDAAPVGDNPAVADRRFGDRQDPGGVIANQLRLNGSRKARCLPDRLRAG